MKNVGNLLGKLKYDHGRSFMAIPYLFKLQEDKLNGISTTGIHKAWKLSQYSAVGTENYYVDGELEQIRQNTRYNFYVFALDNGYLSFALYSDVNTPEYKHPRFIESYFINEDGNHDWAYLKDSSWKIPPTVYKKTDNSYYLIEAELNSGQIFKYEYLTGPMMDGQTDIRTEARPVDEWHSGSMTISL